MVNPLQFYDVVAEAEKTAQQAHGEGDCSICDGPFIRPDSPVAFGTSFFCTRCQRPLCETCWWDSGGCVPGEVICEACYAAEAGHEGS